MLHGPVLAVPCGPWCLTFALGEQGIIIIIIIIMMMIMNKVFVLILCKLHVHMIKCASHIKAY